MGILDSKSRIIDVLITNEGRRQLVNGQMVVEHVSFSDNSTNYSLDREPIDITSKIILEANDLPQDQITPETDINQFVRNLNFSSLKVVNGDFYSLEGNLQTSISSSLFQDVVSSYLKNNFDKLQIIKTKDEFDEISFKEKSNLDKHTFIVEKTGNDTLPGPEESIDNMPTLYSDPDVSFSKMYKFLPPVLPLSGNVNPEPIYNYNYTGQQNILTSEALKARLANLNDSKKLNLKFESSGKTHIQFFQLQDNSKMLKLDMIKFNNLIIDSIENEVYFVGRILQDSSNNTTFFRMFTILIK